MTRLTVATILDAWTGHPTGIRENLPSIITALCYARIGTGAAKPSCS